MNTDGAELTLNLDIPLHVEHICSLSSERGIQPLLIEGLDDLLAVEKVCFHLQIEELLYFVISHLSFTGQPHVSGPLSDV